MDVTTKGESRKCMVVFCKSKGAISGISYFKLTQNRYYEWLVALGIDPMSNCCIGRYICSAHFLSEDITVSPRGRLLLRPGALPSMNLGPNVEVRKSLIREQKLSATISVNIPGPSTSDNHDVEPIQIEETTEMEWAILNDPVQEVVIPETKLETDQFDFSSDSSTLTCDSREREVSQGTIWDDSNLYCFFLILQLCCIWLIKKPHISMEWEEKIRSINLKRKLGEFGSFSSSSDSAGLKGSPKRARKNIRFMHTYCKSPRKFFAEQKEQITQKKKLQSKLASTKRKVRRLQKKVTSLKQVTMILKNRRLLSDDAVSVLEKSFSGIPLELMRRCFHNLRNKEKGKKQMRMQFPEELRSFAMTLQFYSHKAYEYVRKIFSLALPSTSVIRSWLNRVDCQPGFTACAFQALQNIVRENTEKKEPTLCSLVFDEMAIRQQIDFVGQKTWGYIDMGTDISDDTLNCASEVLVVMVVSLKAKWKLPIAYFLIKSLTASEKANIVRQALVKLDQIGVTVASLTCDGPSGNFAMAKELGADFSNVTEIKSHFLHPVNNSKVYIIFDPCHMLKLLRNNWAKCTTFMDINDQPVDFSYVRKLYELQEAETFRFGTKLRKAHMEWEKQKMKVNLAAQVISRSVADAITSLQCEFLHPDFENAGPTAHFLKLYDALFDIMNSRNPFGRGSKSPLKKSTENYWRSLLEEARLYTMSLKDTTGQNMCTTRNKTPFLGFLINIQSYLGIYDDYVRKENAPLKYLMTYKTSQDHLELFFLGIRARNVWNNNPTAFQFFNSYRRMALNLDIKGTTGNCSVLDDTSILCVPAGNKKMSTITSLEDLSIVRKYNIDVPESIEFEDELIELIPSLSDISENVVAYIAGFVVRKMKRITFCSKCISLLEQNRLSTDDTYFKLLNQKNRGGLLRPSADLISICIYVGKKYRYVVSLNDNRMPKEKHFFEAFVTNLTRQVIEQKKYFVFDDEDHVFEHTFLENPYSKIIKNVISIYAKIRFYSLAKKQTEEMKGDLIRKKFTKLILFSGQ